MVIGGKMNVFQRTFVEYWKSYWRRDNLALWIAIFTSLLGIQFFLIWQGIYRALLYIATYFRPIRPFLIQWFGFPSTALATPTPKLSFLILISSLIRIFVVAFYIGTGIWLTTKVGFWGLNIFYLFYQAYR
jgi:hypothetical protein